MSATSRHFMAVDTSALVAYSENEDRGLIDWKAFITFKTCLIGTPTWLELGIVIARKHNNPLRARQLIDRLQRLPNIHTIAFDDHHLTTALDAFSRFGKGNGHPAQLNYGDCMAYAVAKIAQVPLLFKGDDFAKTDIESALL